MNMKSLLSGRGSLCDLCHHHQPSFYCSSDSAFLCSDCDSQVHSANFLVARHIRLSLCKSSSSSTCSSSSSSTTKSHIYISSTSTKAKAKAKAKVNNKALISDWKTRDVLVNWCRKLGLGIEVIEVAKHAFEASWGLVWPYRLGLAASLWLGVLLLLKEDENNEIRMLVKRLEEISGVPAKSIMLAQSKLLKIMNHQHRHQVGVEVEVEAEVEAEEGWAES